ncbi:helix-turn-helix transcriptional regulator [Virgibacillus oceani]|uniref:Transcriptional regulator n=1 Tax=Virgibacillus oceani TaxID=1479511 RepID=A0A917H0R6_9BACI|nr:helix-turn-helix domain-containing protein [Virgibacillus oceani]GGG63736.1 transcriptional regulator [Virgibacillus oceani]
MEKALQISSVLGDPTRFNIYQYIVKQNQEVNVSEIAKQFEIHPNVARLHLSKLEDVSMIVSYPKKTGKGGRPSRLYKLSDEVIELSFPHRDYKLLSSIAIESFSELGEAGKHALYNTGRKYGLKVIERLQTVHYSNEDLTVDKKIHLLENAGHMLGMYPNFTYNQESNSITFCINNCPFKEVASHNHKTICEMHNYFLKGMFEALFNDVELIEEENMFQGCESCTYVAKLSIV